MKFELNPSSAKRRYIVEKNIKILIFNIDNICMIFEKFLQLFQCTVISNTKTIWMKMFYKIEKHLKKINGMNYNWKNERRRKKKISVVWKLLQQFQWCLDETWNMLQFGSHLAPDFRVDRAITKQITLRSLLIKLYRFGRW